MRETRLDPRMTRMSAGITIFLFQFLAGCTYDKHTLFEYYVQGTVGKVIDLWGTELGKGGYGPPGLLGVQEKSKEIVSYVYGKGDLCRWSFDVEKNSRKIIRWEYISKPELCILEAGSGL